MPCLEFDPTAKVVVWQKLKTVCYSPRNGQNIGIRRVFTMCLNRVPRLIGPWVSVWNPNTMWYSPRKWPKYVKTTTFQDVLKSCTWDDGVMQIGLELQIYVPQTTKTVKICETGEFPRRTQFAYRGSRGRRSRPETPKLCAIAHEKGQIMRK